MKKLLVVLVMILTARLAPAQVEGHVKWAYGAKKIAGTEASVLLKADLDFGWHIYAVNVVNSPIKTTIKFAPSAAYQTVGKIIEPKPMSNYNPGAKMTLTYFENTVVFQQKIKLSGKKATVKGTLDYVVCSDHKCLPPERVEFTVPVAI